MRFFYCDIEFMKIKKPKFQFRTFSQISTDSPTSLTLARTRTKSPKWRYGSSNAWAETGWTAVGAQLVFVVPPCSSPPNPTIFKYSSRTLRGLQKLVTLRYESGWKSLNVPTRRLFLSINLIKRETILRTMVKLLIRRRIDTQSLDHRKSRNV